MQGLWKENLGGWNAKDCRRKSQSRNNTLRDKGRVLLKAQEHRKDIGIWEEGEVEHIEDEPIYIKSDWCELWSVRRSKDYLEKIGRAFYAIEYNGRWFDHVTYQEFDNQYTIVRLGYVDKEEFELDIPKKISSRGYYRSHSETITFIFGKPVPNWKRWTFYDDGKRRKIAQKMASSSDRAKLREWIANSNWDAEIGTHALSKSVLWEI